MIRRRTHVLFGLFGLLAMLSATEAGAWRFGAGGREENLGNLRSAGLTWTRVPNDVKASDISGGIPVAPVVQMFDQRVAEAQSRGLKVYAIVNPKKDGSGNWPSTDDFASVVGYFVERYDHDGINDMPGLLGPVTHWEIVNEYLSNDPQGNWAGFPQQTYVECCQKTRAAVKGAYADAKFSIGSIVGGERHDFSDFKAVIGSGVQVDFISYHGYSPTDFLLTNATDDLWTYNPALKQIPFVVTECAFYDNPAQVSATQLQNAKWLPMACSRAFHLNAEIIIYAEMTANPMWTDERLLWMAMIDQSGLKRPNYYAYVKMNQLIGRFASVVDVSPSPGIHLYKYELTSGPPVYIGWTDSSTGGTIPIGSLDPYDHVTVSHTVPNTSGDVVDLPVSFKEWSVAVVSGTTQIVLTTDMPVYIVPQPGKPQPDIKANGGEGPVAVSAGTPVSVTVGLNPGDFAGFNADWWIAVSTPFPAPSNWYTYVYPTGWIPGVHLCAQTPLFRFSGFEVLNMALPVGSYTFYFAVDPPDGTPTAEIFDSVAVQVTP